MLWTEGESPIGNLGGPVEKNPIEAGGEKCLVRIERGRASC